MDDATALIVEKVRIHLDVTGRAVDIQARRHIAVLAVALAAGAGAAVGAGAGQVPAWAAAAAAVAAATAAGVQVHGLGRLTRTLRDAQADAAAHIDTLMLEEDP